MKAAEQIKKSAEEIKNVTLDSKDDLKNVTMDSKAKDDLKNVTSADHLQHATLDSKKE